MNEAALSPFFAWYNFCRKHQTFNTTPAVASGVASEPWTLERLLSGSAKGAGSMNDGPKPEGVNDEQE